MRAYRSRGGGDEMWGMSKMFIVCVIVLLIVFGIVAYAKWKSSPQRFTQHFTQDACADPDYTVIFFLMERCPHCVKFRPEWEKFKKMAGDTKYFEKKVCIKEYSADKDSQKCQDYGVEGYPTVILENNKTGRRVDYDGPRTADAVRDFVSQKMT